MEEKNEELPEFKAKVRCRYFEYKKSRMREYAYIRFKIKKLQFDTSNVFIKGSKLYINQSKNPEKILKVLILS